MYCRQRREMTKFDVKDVRSRQVCVPSMQSHHFNARFHFHESDVVVIAVFVARIVEAIAIRCSDEFCWLAFEITDKFLAIFAIFSSFSLLAYFPLCHFAVLSICFFCDIRDSSQLQSEELRIKSFRFRCV